MKHIFTGITQVKEATLQSEQSEEEEEEEAAHERLRYFFVASIYKGGKECVYKKGYYSSGVCEFASVLDDYDHLHFSFICYLSFVEEWRDRTNVTGQKKSESVRSARQMQKERERERTAGRTFVE